jgi:hypothetical protein
VFIEFLNGPNSVKESILSISKLGVVYPIEALDKKPCIYFIDDNEWASQFSICINFFEKRTESFGKSLITDLVASSYHPYI